MQVQCAAPFPDCPEASFGDEQRPIKTLPSVLHIAPSAKAPRRYGIFTSEAVPARTVFGPYEGARIDDLTKTSSYTWQLPGTGKAYRVDAGPPIGRWGDGIPYLVDGRPLAESNWMRYVQAAQDEDEQNLASFIGFDGHIYYRVRYALPAGRELLVRRPGPFGWPYNTRPPTEGKKEDIIPDGAVLCTTCNRLRLGCDGQCDECRAPPENEGQFQGCSDSTLERLEADAAHEGTDVDKNPFSCQSCDKRFATRNGLSGHMRVHVKRRPPGDSCEQSSLALPVPLESQSSNVSQFEGTPKQQLVTKQNDRPDFKSENDRRLTRAAVAGTHEKVGNAQAKVKLSANPNSRKQAMRGDGLRKGLVNKRPQTSSSSIGIHGSPRSSANSIGSHGGRRHSDKQQALPLLTTSRSAKALPFGSIENIPAQCNSLQKLKLAKQRSDRPSLNVEVGVTRRSITRMREKPAHARAKVKHRTKWNSSVSQFDCFKEDQEVGSSPRNVGGRSCSSGTSDVGTSRSPNSSASRTRGRNHNAKPHVSTFLPKLRSAKTPPQVITVHKLGPALHNGFKKRPVVKQHKSSRNSNAKGDRRLTRRRIPGMSKKPKHSSAKADSQVSPNSRQHISQLCRGLLEHTAVARRQEEVKQPRGRRDLKSEADRKPTRMGTATEVEVSTNINSHGVWRGRLRKRHVVSYADSSGSGEHSRSSSSSSSTSGISDCGTRGAASSTNTENLSSNAKRHVSPSCSSRFPRPDHSNPSRVLPEGTPATLCRTCGRRFSRRDNVERHERYLHAGVKPKPHQCPTCRSWFSRKDNLLRHMEIHIQSKPHSCNVCGARFSRSDHASRHQQVVHATVRPHACPLCGRRFVCIGGVKRHLITHSNVRPYPCSLCDKQFRRSDHLQRHLVTHGGDRVHPCGVCGKRFRRRDHLRRHIVIHTR
ncbi:hypothetical protein HPB48_020636 [Haemaphysalis longicornis]|uniref:Zinc finger protein 865 n=1 Tax=Haemaphysalis longicornis TaxID=44386 RepID=A0A9J6H189_HAELO|nr:hypothetical protein HPB48_020636 [Haemaphysalis longicornis]